MRNINYFCNVKRLRNIITTTAVCLIALICSEIQAANSATPGNAERDSIKISLLTCSPGTEVYSLYGHTAIRLTDYGRGVDVAVNYGMFSFGKPFFVLRFIFGITDYEMGIIPFEYFCREYESEGRSIYQQELNLTADEKLAIRDALAVNYMPQNRVYRYNYFYDNCTTRARDILINNIKGKTEVADAKKEYPSFRELTHMFNKDYPWARFGNDILLGVKSDKKTDLKEHQFLPSLLQEDFSNTIIKNADGTERPLVLSEGYVIKEGPKAIGKGFPLRPSSCAWIIFAVTVAVSLLEARKGYRLWPFDTFMMIFYGCMGVIVFMMFFSQHPTTSTNLQVLLFNPLPLFFAYRTAKRAMAGRPDPFWKYAIIFTALFFIGGFFQDYAEGTYVLALSLLVRSAWNIFRQHKLISTKG